LKAENVINIDKQGNGDSKSENTEKKEDAEQLTRGKSEEEAEMKRFLPSISNKPDPSVTKRTQPHSKIGIQHLFIQLHQEITVYLLFMKNISIFLKFQFIHPVADVLHIQ
jgi:hypothetical protein